MGTFGGGGFENDVALDFAASIASPDDIASVFSNLSEDPTETTDVDQSQQIIAAAECIAAMMGRPADDIPDNLEKQLENFDRPNSDLIEMARDAVSRVLFDSELLELWADADPAPFNRAITGLIDRLNPENTPVKKRDKKKVPVLQICSFCNREIEMEELHSFEIRFIEEDGAIGSGLNPGAWCHFTCLNERLHPRHLVQNWKFDPEEISRQADKLLDKD